MVAQQRDLWSLTWGKPQVDPAMLAEAVRQEVHHDELDFRTRLLIRDSINALKGYWGRERVETWLAACPEHDAITAILQEDLGEPGFPTLRRRLVDTTKPETIRQYLHDLGEKVRTHVKVYIGGSAALILPGYLIRLTEDLDVVNEVPSEVRSLHAILDELEKRFGLKLAHFQSHYLPKGWLERVHWLEAFGSLEVYLVDVYDVFLSKLFSARTKDKDDLRLVAPQLDKEMIIRRLRETTADMLATPGLREKAEKNWHFLYGEPLPT